MQVTSILPRLNPRFTTCEEAYKKEQIIWSGWKVSSFENNQVDKKYQLSYREIAKAKLFSIKVKVYKSYKKCFKSKIYV